jgi:hypothetical protein
MGGDVLDIGDEEPRRYTLITLDEIGAKATNLNCKVVVGDRDELLLDIDEAVPFEAWQQVYARQLTMIFSKFGFRHYRWWRSKGGGLHVIVAIRTSLDRNAASCLQALLGSDPQREILTVWEVCHGGLDYTPNRILFLPNTSTITTDTRKLIRALPKPTVPPPPLEGDDDPPVF